MVSILSIGSAALVAHGAGTDVSGNTSSAEETTPAATEETTPAAAEETTPAATEETTSAPAEETAPAAANESSGTISGNSVPAAPSMTAEERHAYEQDQITAEYNAEVAKMASEVKAVQDTFIMSSANNNTITVAGPGTKVNVSANYAEVDNKDAKATVLVPKADPACEALANYVAAIAPAAEKVYGPMKVQMYVKGDTIWSDFGTFTLNVDIAPKYNGKTATVYQYLKDGTVLTTTAVAQNGHVPVVMSEMGSVAVVFD